MTTEPIPGGTLQQPMSREKMSQKPIQRGDRALNFSLPTQNGQRVSLNDFHGRRAVVLFFYPKDNAPPCTAEACSFRDSYEIFKEAGAEVIGVSSDSEKSHQQFASKYNLPFLLLSDRNGELRKNYGVPTTFGILPGRVTYVIDKQGIVRHIFSSQMATTKHVEESLKILKTLK